MTSGVRIASPRRSPNHAARRAFLIGAVAALAAIAPPTQAQTTTGNIRGYVRGPNNTAVPDAQVAARDPAMGTNRGTVSNTSGFYSLAGLRPGNYELTVRRIGFTPQTRTVTVGIGQTLTVDFSIQQAAAQIAAVQVVATPTETARTSEVGTNVSEEQIQRLPNFERNFLDLARLAPGITPTAVNSTDKFISAGGQPAEAVNVFVDGATYKNDVLLGGVVGQDASKGNPFPQGAVQEFRIITQNYKAEYQKAASAIITATTRSGTNQWEADAFAFGVGKSYVARDAFSASRGDPRPDYQRLQAGGSIGGPLVQNKLFLFGTYEFNGRNEPEYVRLGGDTLFAPPSLVSSLQPLTGQSTSEFREHLGFGKLTWAKSDRSTVDLSGSLRKDTDFRGFGGTTTFQGAENLDVNVYTGVANWRYAADRWINEAQVNVQHFTWGSIPKSTTPIVQDYQNLLRVGGKDASQDFTQNRISLRNDVTRTAAHWGGDHTIKGGVYIDFLTYEAIKNQQATPVYRYRKDEDFARPFEAVYGFGDPKVSTNNRQFGAYLQDDWSVTPRLVLNLGLRWDAETNMINNNYVTPTPLADSLRGPLNGQLYVNRPVLRSNGVCCDTTQVRVIDELGGLNRFITTGKSDRPIYLGAWQPRVGASYDLTGNNRTVLFGGVGIYYDRNYWNSLFDERFRRQYSIPIIEFRDACPAGSPVNCVVWDPKYLDPNQLKQLSGTAGLPEVFLVGNDLKPPKTYQFSGGVRQGWGRSLVTLSYNGVRGYNGMNFVQASPSGGLGPNYAQAFVTDDRVKTWYDAMQLQIDRPILADTRWGGAIAYTLARSQEQGQSTDLFWGFDNRYPTVGDLPQRRAPGNQVHTITANAIVRIPWQVYFSTIINLGSGQTVNALDNTNGSAYGQQISYVYAPPTKPFLGIGHVFAYQNVDLRLEKAFTLASAQRISVVADLFNAFNNGNYGCFNTTIENPPNPNYNTPGCAGLGRRLQLGLRYGLQPIHQAGTQTR
ncbi:MAG TPA: carboxypeptidase regulatory-like domain-containing protein [Gemmatimonadaceae bacterium]|nr:carboxypeptidase regulatory-like domain-containing protein [Gemmatimonadaceae bacterium]